MTGPIPCINECGRPALRGDWVCARCREMVRGGQPPNGGG